DDLERRGAGGIVLEEEDLVVVVLVVEERRPKAEAVAEEPAAAEAGLEGVDRLGLRGRSPDGVGGEMPGLPAAGVLPVDRRLLAGLVAEGEHARGRCPGPLLEARLRQELGLLAEVEALALKVPAEPAFQAEVVEEVPLEARPDAIGPVLLLELAPR